MKARITQLSTLKLVRKPLPPAGRAFKDKRRGKRAKNNRLKLDLWSND